MKFAAAMAWIWLREAARWQTMFASLIALCGIVLIVSNAQASADVGGIGLACIMVLAISAMTVVMRRYRRLYWFSGARAISPRR